jgi:hypothetical protein
MPSHWMRWGLENFLPWLALNHYHPNLWLASSYRLNPLCPGIC